MIDSAVLLDHANERQGLFQRRAFLLGGGFGLGLVALGGRLAYLQLLEAGRYKLLSEHNQFQMAPTTPPRGLILDRGGVVLASNRPDFRLLLANDDNIDVEATLRRLAELVPMTEARLLRLKQDIEDAPRRAPVAVVEDMSWEEFSRVNVRSPELPGVTADMGEVRVYPFAGAFAHVVGYVAKVSAKDVTKTGPNAQAILLNPGFRIGKRGIEKAFDLPLRGTPGARKIEVDVKGRVVRRHPGGDVPATPGSTIQLTIDADIQNRGLEVFGDDSGAAVMMDVRNGDVLCMLSAPSFDANEFVRGMTGPDYRQLSTYDRKPLFDKALSATYPPGSTFKTMVAMAALENGVDPARTYTCHGSISYGGRVFHCDRVHGTLGMHDAIKTSCDVFFYETALGLGPNKIAAMARKFGLGDTFDIGLHQRPGIVPDTDYKRRAFPHDPVWHGGETPSMGIGQGYLNLNPLQLCVMAARLAGAGVALQPRLIHSIGGVVQPSGAAAPRLDVAPEHLAFVRAAMASVANDAGGTASKNVKAHLDLGPVKMAGKTGTAQAHSYGAGSRKMEHATWALKDHAWFIAFAPYDDPRYAISVLVEHGGFGAEAAAPKAAELLRVALLKDPDVRARIVTIPDGIGGHSPASSGSDAPVDEPVA